MTYLLEVWDKEYTRKLGYHDDFFKIPTHKALKVPDDNEVLGINDFIVYANPRPRDYGQTNQNRTAEPIKLALVDNDWEWRLAVANWFESQLFQEQPWGLQDLIRRPRTTGHQNFRVHYARFLLPLDINSTICPQPYYDRRWSPSFTAYYIGTGENRRYINEFIIDAAYRADPIGWNASGRRATTVPQDWITNRIDENKHKYDLFA